MKPILNLFTHAAAKLFAVMLGLVLLTLLASVLPGGRAGAQTVPFNEAGFGCSPQVGKGLKWGLTLSPAGGWLSYWCRGTDGAWHLRILAQPATDMVAQADAYADVLNAADYNAALTSFMAAYPAAARKVSDASIKPIWIGSVAKIEGSKPVDPAPPVTPPVVKTFIVAPNGSAKTRQWYPFAANVGRTSTAGGGSVTIAGTSCKPEVAAVTEVGVVFAAFGPTFRPDRVTQCIQAP
jgi:hypothetical protein